jgi:hypothetical protein
VFLKLLDFYCLPDIIKIINSKRIRWAGHEARMRDKRIQSFGKKKNLQERDHSEDLDVDKSIIFMRILDKQEGCAPR